MATEIAKPPYVDESANERIDAQLVARPGPAISIRAFREMFIFCCVSNRSDGRRTAICYRRIFGRGDCLAESARASKVEKYVSAWGIQHFWIIDPATPECFEYRGGDEFFLKQDQLNATPIALSISSIFGEPASLETNRCLPFPRHS